MINPGKWKSRQRWPDRKPALSVIIAAGMFFTTAAGVAGPGNADRQSGVAESAGNQSGMRGSTTGGATNSIGPKRPATEVPGIADRFPYRYIGLGGANNKREYIVLTDGANSFVAHRGETFGDRYKVDELTSRALVVTDLVTRERFIIPYKEIQSASSEPPHQDAPAITVSRTAESPPPARSLTTPAGSQGEAPRAPTQDESADPQASDDDDGLRAMIAPPPVNRAEQAMPMEMTPPPKNNPMIITTPTQDISMITTPSRREHMESVDIPLGPGVSSPVK